MGEKEQESHVQGFPFMFDFYGLNNVSYVVETFHISFITA
jgi:hypothetical protein